MDEHSYIISRRRKHLHHNKDSISHGFIIFLFNAAISVELILKHILVKKKTDVPKSHNLRDLFKNADITLENNQASIIDFLTESIIWLGRYPAPTDEKHWDNYHDKILENTVIRTQSGNIYTSMANPDTFPSLRELSNDMENLSGKI